MQKGKTTSVRSSLPPALSSGDTIRIIAPASPFDSQRFFRSVTWLEDRGYQVKYDRGVFSKDGYLAGDDERRKKEFVSAWKDPECRAVFVARGGYGTMRLFLEKGIDPLSKQSKIFMGLSDVTVLLNYVARKTSLVTIHGPVMAGTTSLNGDVPMSARQFSYLEDASERTLRSQREYNVVIPGNAKGKLWGGNLSLVQSTLSTKLEIPFSGALLFLEEVNEPLYRVDRMFAQLELAGVFKKIRALLLGTFLDPDGTTYSSSSLEKLVDRYVKKWKIPVAQGLRAGHSVNDVWLPIGGACRIEDRGKKIRLSPLVKARS